MASKMVFITLGKKLFLLAIKIFNKISLKNYFKHFISKQQEQTNQCFEQDLETHMYSEVCVVVSSAKQGSLSISLSCLALHSEVNKK